MSRSEILEVIKEYDYHNTCMTVEQCAEYLSVCTKTVLQKIHSGEIKSYKSGTKYSIPKIQYLQYKTYTIEYWFLDSNDSSDYNQIEVEAKSKSEALEIAKEKAHTRNARNFKIIDNDL
tara:strand:+ start:705 stop:1061 length:357 start_codon:yes stop_codon:yes gene_type:complete